MGGAARLLIAAFKGERNSSRARQSPASGKYRFTGLWAGTFKIVFSPEASEFEEAEGEGITPDAYPTQWWYGQSTFAAATSIAITPPSTVEGVDGSLGPGPPAAATPSPAPTSPLSPPVQKVVKPKPKPLKCRHAFVKKKVKGKVRCVKRHTPKHHRGKPAKSRKHSRT